MATADKHLYACCYCMYNADDIDAVINHTLKQHNEMLSIREKCICAGQYTFRSINFNTSCSKVNNKISQGYKLVVDKENNSIRFKRHIEHDEHEISESPDKSDKVDVKESGNSQNRCVYQTEECVSVDHTSMETYRKVLPFCPCYQHSPQ